AGDDPRPGARGAAGRAAGAAHDRAGQPLARARRRRAAPDARPRGRGRHRARRAGLPHMTLAFFLTVDWQTLADALALGGVYALMAVGIGLVFGVLRLVNFAYGQLVMAGAFALALGSQWNWPTWLSIVLCFVVVLVLSALLDRLVFRPLRGQSPAV